MPGLKENWLNYVKKQSDKTARDPNAKIKVVGWVIVLLLIGYNVRKAESSIIGCAPCIAWAVQFCSPVIAAGGACASVAMFPPLLCACLLTAGGLACAAAGGTCIVACIAPTP